MAESIRKKKWASENREDKPGGRLLLDSAPASAETDNVSLDQLYA